MKRNFSKKSHREKSDKIEKRSNTPGTFHKDKSSQRGFPMYEDIEEEFEELDPKLVRLLKSKK
ncbi:MAG: hypothetical protein WBK43_05355 [Prolixibacteraceae bacterium]|jgi:hypothetical protein|nr:hypothetical protein [Prolixibacteraceae bacterium]MDI9563205.1 hypothetical protein [Bacteroidota bacterium]NLS99931.1 hypothetical protein [Bacteroidales bacterium]OQB81145.1 MAG: hypothetical protein BWX87_00930 [Bacteroidetes bacterium ADurb.Bin123]HNU78404.1 hypothetical protein [Prolixibacteraceae bacterium]